MRNRVITLIVASFAGLGFLSSVGFQGVQDPPGGGCPGKVRTLSASTTFYEERVGFGGIVTFTGVVRSSQGADVPTGHVVANLIQLFVANHQ